MKGFGLTGMVVVLALSASCQRSGSVQAGGEKAAAYRPKTVPSPGEVESRESAPVRADLRKVDLKRGWIVIRLPNGMEQTLEFNNGTTVSGLNDRHNAGSGAKQLAGMEGSEVSVAWSRFNDGKLATSIDVVSPHTRKIRRR